MRHFPEPPPPPYSVLFMHFALGIYVMKQPAYRLISATAVQKQLLILKVLDHLHFSKYQIIFTKHRLVVSI